MGDEELAREIEDLFLETVGEQLASISESFHEGAARSLAAKLHKLKGTLANLGASRAAETVRRAEVSVVKAELTAKDVEALLEEVEALRREVLAVRKA